MTPDAAAAPAEMLLPHVDREAFARDLDALRAEVEASLSPEDRQHLLRIAGVGRLCTALGYATAWMGPNPVSMALLSLGPTIRWTCVAHHILHRGLDRVPGTPAHLTSKGFARGARRFVDWPDWLDPAAWDYEHNVLHHHRTGEAADPDLVEENATGLRAWKGPRALKLAAVGFYALTWKWSYYAPSTWQVLGRAEARRARNAPMPPGVDAPTADARGPERYLEAFDPRTAAGRAFWRRCMAPYGLARFVLGPLVFAPLGPGAVASVWANCVGAEMLGNLHTFVIIAPNHAGDDLYRFDGPTRDRGERYLRQVLGTANFRTGGALRDLLHGYLNYQIEHHLFPDLPPRQYAHIQPRVKALCEKHGVPYVQEGVWRRARKMVRVMVGDETMQRPPTAP